ncbi:pyridine nucleotide-disulfide oxidoreductase [Bacteroidia bacterium]|nr:pyridine nucleotide-disulfide oxidoreductase [Bacteroidia bacterium]
MKTTYFITPLLICLLFACTSQHADLWIETEGFSNKGGWVVDQQFMDLMGSPYLMAHGMGQPVKDATTTVSFPQTGSYHLFVRSYNWTSPWLSDKGPGKFQVLIDGNPVPVTFGDEGNSWLWQDGGTVEINSKDVQISLHDLTGFNGRCDAIYFTQANAAPPVDVKALTTFRHQKTGIVPKEGGNYDLVVIGGGIGGICTAVSAARLGLKVAFIQDRPIWGGNNSSEVRVHLGGRIGLAPYPELGGIVKELSPMKGGNAQPATQYEDEKKIALVNGEPNIIQFLSYHAFAVEMNGSEIKSVTAKHIETGEERVFTAPLFVDCTGDGTIGALAGADFSMGRESKAEFGESTAPEVGDKMTMGSSVQWYSEEKDSPSSFPLFKYGMNFNNENAQIVTMGEWTWETGMNFNQITDFERIRDYGMLVVYSNWSFLKNEYSSKERYANRALGWVAYVAGKRESRRLLGDIILRQQDVEEYILYPDASASVSWSIDLHYPDPKNSEQFPGNEFRSICEQPMIYPYPVPYRCLYSRNIGNLFMTGRNMSVTHVALGTTRQMRTIGMLGEVVGMAASVCKQHNVQPRGVYEQYLEELKSLMVKGVGKEGTAGYPQYNLGEMLKEKKNIQ